MRCEGAERGVGVTGGEGGEERGPEVHGSDSEFAHAVRYFGHSERVCMIRGHAMQALVATCSISGEVLLWRTAVRGAHTHLQSLAAAHARYAQ